MRGKMWIGCVVVISCLGAPAAAMAGNEAAPWSAPTYLDAGESNGTGVSGISLSELADGGLVATWNEFEGVDGAFPQMSSEPFEGSWSTPTSLTTTAETDPQDQLGGARTAVDANGQFVSVWQTPAASDQGTGENDIVGVSGSVTPGDQPAFTAHTWGLGYAPNVAPQGMSFQYPFTPQVAMSSDGTGSVEFTAAGSNADGITTDKQLVALEGASPDPLTWRPPIYDNPADGSSDYDKYVPQLAVAGLDAAWSASTNDTEAMLATSANYYGQSALLYTTADPADWYGQSPTTLPMLGELTTAGVLPNGNVVVANDADDLGASDTWGTGDYGIEVWETGDTSATVLDGNTGGPAGYPAVATFNNGDVTIAYVDAGPDGLELVKEVTFSDGQWSDPVTVWSGATDEQVLDLTDAYGPDGTTYVAWDTLDTSAPVDDALYASVRLPGASFPATPDTVYQGSASDPKIAVDQTGYATIVAAVLDKTTSTERAAAFTFTNPVPPRLVDSPTVTVAGGGAAQVGSSLVCAGDSWLNRPTEFQVAWLRGSSPIAGATARTYTAASADAGQLVSCQVTATNSYGSGLGQSAGVKVATASSAKTNVSPAISSVRTGSGNSVTVTISCPATAASCTAVVAQITVVEELVGNKVVAVIARGKRHKRTVVIGQTKTSLEPGQERSVTVHLNGTGRKLLDRHVRLKVRFTVATNGQELVSRSLTLKRPKTKRRR
jgi:hypothetical protein